MHMWNLVNKLNMENRDRLIGKRGVVSRWKDSAIKEKYTHGHDQVW